MNEKVHDQLRTLRRTVNELVASGCKIETTRYGILVSYPIETNWVTQLVSWTPKVESD